MKKGLRWKRALALLLTLTLLCQSLALTSFAAVSGASAEEAASTPVYPYQDTSLSFEERAADLVSRMTTEEKYNQLHNGRNPNAPAIPRLGVDEYQWWSEALHGVARNGTATSFPTGLGIGATWDPELVQEMMSVTSDEAREKFNTVPRAGWHGLAYWSPTINMARDPRWGRAEETYGEDPFLTAQIGGGFVRGLQGEGEENNTKYLKAIATPKHFMANNSESNRHSGTSNFDERTLREYYGYAFKSTVEDAHAESIMTSYNRVNGVPSTVNLHMLDDLLRRTWGFDGYVVTDCDTLGDITGRHPWRPDTEGLEWGNDWNTLPEAWKTNTAWGGKEATALSLMSGTDANCGSTMANNAKSAVEAGLMSEDDVDVALVRQFTARMRTGEFDPADMVPYSNLEKYGAGKQIQVEEHRALAEQGSDNAVVLLKNEPVAGAQEKVLPLKGIENLVVIGDLADEVILGDYSVATPQYTSKPTDGIKAALLRANPDAAFTYIQGNAGGGSTNNLMNTKGPRFCDADGAELLAIDWNKNDEINGCQVESGGNVGYIGKGGAWIKFNSLDFTDVKNVKVDMAGSSAAAPTTLEIRLDNPDAGQLLGQMTLGRGNTGAWGNYETYTFEFTGAAGGYAGPQNNVYFVLKETPSTGDGFTIAEQEVIKNADAVVAFVGTRVGENGYFENTDGYNLNLPNGQAALVSSAAALNPNTVVYMQAVSQINVETFKDAVPAILWSTYNGQAQGNAAGRLLFGEANPSAKLPFTWYTSVNELANVQDYQIRSDTADGSSGNKGRTYQYFTGGITYPFGHGLSYSDFAFSGLTLNGVPDGLSVTPDDVLTVEFDVENTSAVDGAEVGEVYVISPDADRVNRPAMRLKGFDKQTIAAGETAHYAIDIPVADLYYWDEENSIQTYDQGEYTIQVGSSSGDAALTGTFTLSGRLTPQIKTVKAIPTGHILDVADPGKTISTKLSASRNDQTFADLSEAGVTYTSSKPGVAAVDRNGVVTAVGGGVATITASVTENGVTKSDDYPVVVRQTLAASAIYLNGQELPGFSLSETEYTVHLNGQTFPEITAVPQEGCTVDVAAPTTENPVATITVAKGEAKAVYQIHFKLPTAAIPTSDFTAMDEADVRAAWDIVREDTSSWHVDENGLYIKMLPGDLYNSTNTAKNIFTMKNTPADWAVETEINLSAAATESYQQAGLIAYQDDGNYLKLNYQKGNVEINSEIGGSFSDQAAAKAPFAGTHLWLRLEKAGSTYTAWFSADGQNYTKVGSKNHPINNVKIGVYTNTGTKTATPIDVTFRYVKSPAPAMNDHAVAVNAENCGVTYTVEPAGQYINYVPNGGTATFTITTEADRILAADGITVGGTTGAVTKTQNVNGSWTVTVPNVTGAITLNAEPEEIVPEQPLDYWHKVPNGLSILNDSELKTVAESNGHLLEGSTESIPGYNGSLWETNCAQYINRSNIEGTSARNYIGKDYTHFRGDAKKIIQFTGYRFYIHSVYDLAKYTSPMIITIDDGTPIEVDVSGSGSNQPATVVFDSGVLDGGALKSHTVEIKQKDPNPKLGIYLDALIYADNAKGTFEFTDVSTREVTEGETLTVAVRRYGPADQAASVRLALVHGTTDAEDFTGAAEAQRLEFAAGETEREVTFTLAKDGVKEKTERFTLRLEDLAGKGAVGYDSSVTANVLDNDIDVTTVAVTYEKGRDVQEGKSAVWPLPGTETWAEGAEFALPMPGTDLRKAGFTFAGWTDGEKTYQPGDKYTMPAASVNFDAVWAEKTDGAPEPYGAIPNALQMKYYKEELSGFIHYGTNTYRDIEWGNDGKTLLTDFKLDPASLDTDQWVETFQNAGIKRILFTAKHHDGFRLWKTNEFSVGQVPEANQVDVLEEISKSCTKYDMDMGLYFSPWDIYEDKGKTLTDGGTVPAGGASGTMDGAYSNGSGTKDAYPLDDDYNKLYEGHLKEIFNNDKYGNNGNFVETWFDGANDSQAQHYDFLEWNQITKNMNARGTEDECVNQNCGTYQQVSWPGNERGFVSPDLWSKVTLPKNDPIWSDHTVPGTNITHFSGPEGDQWTIWEGDYSIRPGWFYHASQTGSVKSPEGIFQRYLDTVGHGGVMLLNIPPNKAGKMDQIDADNAKGFYDMVQQTFGAGKNLARGAGVTATAAKDRGVNFTADQLLDGHGGQFGEGDVGYDTYWTMADAERDGSVVVDLGAQKTFDVVELQEYIPLGQRINKYTVEVFKNGAWQLFGEGTVVGYKRFVTGPVTSAQKLRITVHSDYAVPVVNSVGVFKLPASMEQKPPVPDGLQYLNDGSMMGAEYGTPSTDQSNRSDAWHLARGGIEDTRNLIGNDVTLLSQNGYKEVTFTGSKFYIRGMEEKAADAKTDMLVTVDGGTPIVVDVTGQKSGDPRHPFPGSQRGFVVYTSEDLSYGEHTVRIEPQIKSSRDIYMNFDTFIYCDNEKGMFEFEDVGGVTVDEGERITVNVSRLGDVSQTATVVVASYPGTAVHGEDFNQEFITLDFAAGERVKPVSFQTNDNAKSESDQNFLLVLEPTAGIPNSYNMSLRVDIIDNDDPDAPAEDGIYLDGKPLADFDAAVSRYTVTLAEDAAIPAVSATAADAGTWLSVTQAAAVPGSAFVKFINGSTVKSYAVDFVRGGGAVRYDFTKGALPEGWSIAAPDSPEANVTYSGAGVTIASDGNDLPGTKNQLQLDTPTSGDYVLDTHIKLDKALHQNWAKYGITVYNDDKNMVIVDHEHDNRGKVQILWWKDSSWQENHVSQDYAGAEIYFRLVKRGNGFEALYSADGTDYHSVYTAQTDGRFENGKIRLFCSKQSQGNETFHATVDYVTLSPLGQGSTIPGKTELEAVAMDIGTAMTIPAGDYADHTAMAARAQEILRGREDVKALGADVQVAVSGGGYTLTLTKDGQTCAIKAFRITQDQGNIYLDGKPLEGFAADVLTYTVKVWNLPEVTATRIAGGEAKVEQATMESPVATVTVTKGADKTVYTIHFTIRPVSETATNPYMPLWEHIPDGEPHVFEDPDNAGKYRVYVYGSHDNQKNSTYCGYDHVVWSAPVEDLGDWRIENNGEKAYNCGGLLYAPDAVEKDGKYYLYTYDLSHGNSVAVSDRPGGPFVNMGANGAHKSSGMGADPAVLVDDDGRMYGFWGYQTCYQAELDPATMAVKPGTTTANPISNCNQPGEFQFYEGASIRKVDGKYVLVYCQKPDLDPENGVIHNNYRGRLAYAYSDNPLGPWTYGGAIIDNGGELLTNGKTSYYDGNVHGGIIEADDQWYVFYHRMTNKSEFSRQAMLEPLDVTVDPRPGGKVTIEQAEMTSQGAAVNGLNAYRHYDAAIACYLTEGAYITTDYSQTSGYNPVAGLKNGCVMGYKYMDFGTGVGEGEFLQLALDIKAKGAAGTIDVFIDDPNNGTRKTDGTGTRIGSIEVAEGATGDYYVETAAVSSVTGRHALFFVFRSQGENEICEINGFEFTRETSLLRDDFSDTLALWDVTGSPAVSDGAVELKAGDRLTAKGAAAWDNYATELLVSEGGVSLQLRRSDADNYYLAKLTGNTVSLSSVEGGVERPMQSVEVKRQNGKPVRLAVVCAGDQLVVRVNGAPVLVDADSAHTVGGIALEAVGGAAKLDSVMVSAAEKDETLRIDRILVDGKPLAGFDIATANYMVPVSGSPVPTVAAVSSDKTVTVTVKQAPRLPGNAVVTFTDGTGTRTYTITFYDAEGRMYDFKNLSELPKGWSVVHSSGADGITFGSDGVVITTTGKDGPAAVENQLQLDTPLTGDWMADAHIILDRPLKNKYEQYGMFFHRDDSNFVRLNQEQGGSENLQLLWVRDGSYIHNSPSIDATDWTDTYIRLKKTGEQFELYYSKDGENYTFVCAETADDRFNADTRLRLYATSQSGGNPSYHATVEYCKITELGGSAAETYAIDITATETSVQAGGDVAVTVTAKGGEFVGAACKLGYDSSKFELKSVPDGWDDLKTDTFRYYNVINSGFYPEDTVLGTFVFTAKEQEEETIGSFTLSDTYMAGEWEDGWSTDDAEQVPNNGSVDVQIKPVPAYVVEIVEDYVAGYSLVLVYTDKETGAYAYDGEAMYDVTSAGYLHEGTKYAHVYGLVVKNADPDKVASADKSAVRLTYSTDVNGSGKTDLNDAVAVVAVYNANGLYMDAMHMAIVLKADVNGDKEVNVDDFGLIKAEYTKQKLTAQ